MTPYYHLININNSVQAYGFERHTHDWKNRHDLVPRQMFVKETLLPNAGGLAVSSSMWEENQIVILAVKNRKYTTQKPR